MQIRALSNVLKRRIVILQANSAPLTVGEQFDDEPILITWDRLLNLSPFMQGLIAVITVTLIAWVNTITQRSLSRLIPTMRIEGYMLLFLVFCASTWRFLFAGSWHYAHCESGGRENIIISDCAFQSIYKGRLSRQVFRKSRRFISSVQHSIRALFWGELTDGSVRTCNVFSACANGWSAAIRRRGIRWLSVGVLLAVDSFLHERWRCSGSGRSNSVCSVRDVCK